jgi:hypothetical protein
VRDSRFEFEGPAAILDIQLRATGMVPRYLWSIDPGGVPEINLGEWLPRAGASVSGHVISKEGSRGLQGATVALESREGAPIPPSSEVSRRPSSFQTSTDVRGFFQLANVPAAEYLLRASKAGRAEETVPIVVVAAAESQLTAPLALSPPATLEVTIDPARDPWGRPWAIRLMKGAPPRRQVAVQRARADEGGHVKVASIAPGPYLLTVLGSQESRWQSTEIELTPDSRPVAVTLGLLPVEGSVSLGKRPLAAKVVFGGFRRPLSIPLQADEKGEFSGMLPESEEAEWAVYVESIDPPLKRNLKGVRLERSPSGVARVDIVLPEGVLSGRIVDESGKAVTLPTIVQCWGQDEEGASLVLQEQDGGRFRFGGLTPGEYQVSAEAKDGRRSEVTRVSLSEMEDTPPVDLILGGSLRLLGEVVSLEGRPVPGARVKLAAAHAWAGDHDAPMTGADGRFESSLSGQTKEVIASVAAPGFGFSMLRAPFPESGPLVIPVTALSGTLEIELEAAALASPPLDIVLSTGRALVEAAYVLNQWAPMHGGGWKDGTLTLPALAPGDYTICDVKGVPPQLHPTFVLDPSSRGGGKCVSGSLEPGEVLRLKAPRPPSTLR